MPGAKNNVCLIVQNYYDLDIRVRRKAEALIAAGYGVDVLALRSSNLKPKKYTLNGVNVHAFSLGKKRGSKGRYYFEYLAFFFWAFFKLWGLMRHRVYAVIDVNTLPDFLVFAATYARMKGSRVILDMHEITPEFLMSKYGVGVNHWQVRLARFLEKASFSFADHVITINEAIRQLLADRGLRLSKSTIIMNSVDESMFFSASKSPSATNTENQTGKFVMMYHGTLTRLYGLDIALKAFSQVQSEAADAEYWILGDGPEKDQLMKLARSLGLESKVRFCGTFLPQDIRQWLERCDIGVLSTRRDVFLDFSFSNKLSEYIIMGKPVIASRLKAIRHYFSEDALAYFEANDPHDLAQQILRLYRDKELRDRLAKKAAQEYSPIRWEEMKRRYLELVENMAGKSREEQRYAPSRSKF